MRSLYSGVSGLKNHQTRMDVIGNNISNVNTTGFKSSRVTFNDMLSQTLTGASTPAENRGGTNPKQIGLGSTTASIDMLFTNGSVQSTGVNTDLCLSGNGLFVVNDGGQTYYTRNGDFSFDADGNYVQPGSGLFVQGWMAKDGVLDTTGATGNITIPAGKSMEAATTTTAAYSNNLNSETKGYTVAGITVTYEDDTTETVQNYNPTSRDSVVILTLNDGTTSIGDPDLVYRTGQVAGTLWTSKVNSITTTAVGQVALDVALPSDYTLVNGTNIGSLTIPATSVAAGEYTVGGKYTSSKTIAAGGVVYNADDTVTLTFTDSTDGIASVTVPKPTNGIYADGDSFTVELTITGGSATGGTITCENGQTADLAASTPNTATLGANYTKTTTATVDAIDYGTPGTYSFNGKQVSNVSITTADGKTLSGLIGHSYNKNDTFYPSVVTTATVYDSLGANHDVTLLFTKTADNTWKLSLKGGGNVTTISEADGTTTTVNLTSTTLHFDTSGRYVDGSGSLSLQYKNGAADQTIAVNLAALTQYAGSNTINATTDGNAAGVLESVSIDTTGTMTGTYTNGKKRTEAQVAVAQFNNASGLTKTGDSLYQESNNSGTPNVKTATDLGVKITPSALEMSNVDIANEFTDMIVTQRGFQSNAKTIQTADTLLETVLSLKR